jgi:hypothetical protein
VINDDESGDENDGDYFYDGSVMIMMRIIIFDDYDGMR